MKIFKSCILFSLFIMFCVVPIHAWEGYDCDKGSCVEIEKGNLIREGETIEVYDYYDGEYHQMEVESIDDNGSTTNIQVQDQDTGEERTLEMDNHSKNYTKYHRNYEYVACCDGSYSPSCRCSN